MGRHKTHTSEALLGGRRRSNVATTTSSLLGGWLRLHRAEDRCDALRGQHSEIPINDSTELPGFEDVFRTDA